MNVRKTERRTPLMFATNKDRATTVILLLDGVAAVNSTTKANRSALQCAAEAGYGAVVDLLLHSGATPGVRRVCASDNHGSRWFRVIDGTLVGVETT
jgi:ankyrin repeat protein